MSPISEEELRNRLRDVSPTQARPGYAEQVIQRAKFARRRQRWVTGIAAAAAVAVIGGGALVIGDQLGPDEALPAMPTRTATRSEATPAVTSTKPPTATATSSPTPTTTTSRGTTPSTSAGATSTPPPASTPSRPVTLKPVTLLHDGDPNWRRSPFAGGLCVGESPVLAVPQDYAELRVIRAGFLPGANQDEGLVVFRTAADAVAYMARLRTGALGCPDESSDQIKVIVQPLPGPWGEGTTIATAHKDSYSPTGYGGLRVNLFVRVGRAVTFTMHGDKNVLGDSIPPEQVADLRPTVQHVAPQLCRYTQAGC